MLSKKNKETLKRLVEDYRLAAQRRTLAVEQEQPLAQSEAAFDEARNALYFYIKHNL